MNIPNPFIIMAHFDLVGLESESKPTNVKDGSTFFEVDTSNLYVFYKGTWYLQGEQEEQAEEVQNVSNLNLSNINPREEITINPNEEKRFEEIISVHENEIDNIEELEDTEEAEEGEE